MVAPRKNPLQPGLPARERTPFTEVARSLLGIAAILIAVLAVLALVNSFFLEPRAPGDPVDEPGQTGGGGGGSGGGDPCEALVDATFWIFIVLLVLTAGFMGIAYWQRAKYNGEVLTNGWGITGLVFMVLMLLAGAAWQLVKLLCGDPNCNKTADGAWTIFLILLLLTLASCGLGIWLAFRRNKTFFRTGWGLLGVVLFLPTMLMGMFWYVIKVACTQTPCELADGMSVTFWLAMAGFVIAIGIGFFFKTSYRQGLFASGWGVVAVLLLILGAFTGYGWWQVDDLCHPEPEEEPTCKKQLRSLARMFWSALGISLASLAVSIAVFHKQLKRAFSSPLAVVAYIGLAIALLLGLAWLLVDSACNGEEGEQQGDGGDGSGDGGSGQGGNGQGGSGQGGSGNNQGGNTGSGSGGSNTGGGTGGGGGIDGSNLSPPIPPINPAALLWIFAILGGVAAIALLFYLMKQRGRTPRMTAPRVPPPEEVQATERMQLLRLLEQADLQSKEAVIAAYRAFLAWSAGQGHPKTAIETPLEHARRVREAYPIPPDPLNDFIRAYEIARLSARDPTPDERSRAVSFGKRVASGLGASPPKKEEGPA